VASSILLAGSIELAHSSTSMSRSTSSTAAERLEEQVGNITGDL
jgi:hypothetical protein